MKTRSVEGEVYHFGRRRHFLARSRSGREGEREAGQLSQPPVPSPGAGAVRTPTGRAEGRQQRSARSHRRWAAAGSGEPPGPPCNPSRAAAAAGCPRAPVGPQERRSPRPSVRAAVPCRQQPRQKHLRGHFPWRSSAARRASRVVISFAARGRRALPPRRGK